MRYSILFPDGRAVSAGGPGAAVRTLKLTSAAFSGTQLEPGAVCASELEAEFFDDGLALTAGDVLQLYEGHTLLGTFRAETPTTPGPGRRKVLAYDAVTGLDRDLTHWLTGLTDWPYALSDFARLVCQACGLELTGTLANGDWPIPRFEARGITGRQLMQWVCQAGCRFLTALPDGRLQLQWLSDSGITLSPTGEHFYFSGASWADYTAAAVDGIVIALTDSDVGVASNQTAQNSLRIQGNYLLCGCSETEAQAIFDALSSTAYTPCTLETTTPLAPGQRFSLDTGRQTLQAVAMSVENTLGRYRVVCTGSASRSASSALCRGSYRALSGRVLEMQLELQGIHSRMAAFSEDTVKLSSLSQDVDHITARVGVLETGNDRLGQELAQLEGAADQQFAQLSLRSDSLELSVGSLTGRLEAKADSEAVQELSEHFLFDGDGLTISNTATGMAITVSEYQVAFDQGTRITPSDLQTTKLVVGERMDLGAFACLPRSNGNLSFRYTGG